MKKYFKKEVATLLLMARANDLDAYYCWVPKNLTPESPEFIPFLLEKGQIISTHFNLI